MLGQKVRSLNSGRSHFFPNPTDQNANLKLSPTALQWEVDLRVDDYRKKQTKKAGPFLTLP